MKLDSLGHCVWFFGFVMGGVELMTTTSCTYRLGRPQCFYLFFRCDKLAASMASRVLVNQNPSVSVINTTVENFHYIQNEPTILWSLCWCICYHKAKFLGESWTSSKKGFNNMGNGRQDEKCNNWEQTAEDGSSDTINSAGTVDVNDSSGPFLPPGPVWVEYWLLYSKFLFTAARFKHKAAW